MKLKRNITLAVVFALAMVLFAGCNGNQSAPKEALTIQSQPANVAVAMGEEATLSVTVSGGAQSELSYQWFQTKDDVNRVSDDIQIIGNEGMFIPPPNIDGVQIPGATAATYTPSTDLPGVHSYYVEVSDGSETLKSFAATVAAAGWQEDTDTAGSLNILFICGGNTGRSPMSAAIAEQVFAQKNIPAVITSAGTDIIDGDPAEANAVTLMAERGLDLSGHVAAWWTPEMLQNADYIFVMTESHKNRVNVATLGIYADKVFLLREFVGDSGSVPDPFEEPMEKYIETADLLTAAMDKLVDRIATEKAA